MGSTPTGPTKENMNKDSTESGIGAVLEHGSIEELEKLGCGPWDLSAGDKVLYLIPFSLYDFIPNGTKLVDISTRTLVFEHGKTDNDYRYGMLAYDVLRKRIK